MRIVLVFIFVLVHVHSTPSVSSVASLDDGKYDLMYVATPPPCLVLCLVKGAWKLDRWYRLG